MSIEAQVRRICKLKGRLVDLEESVSAASSNAPPINKPEKAKNSRLPTASAVLDSAMAKSGEKKKSVANIFQQLTEEERRIKFAMCTVYEQLCSDCFEPPIAITEPHSADGGQRRVSLADAGSKAQESDSADPKDDGEDDGEDPNCTHIRLCANANIDRVIFECSLLVVRKRRITDVHCALMDLDLRVVQFQKDLDDLHVHVNAKTSSLGGSNRNTAVASTSASNLSAASVPSGKFVKKVITAVQLGQFGNKHRKKMLSSRLEEALLKVRLGVVAALSRFDDLVMEVSGRSLTDPATHNAKSTHQLVFHMQSKVVEFLQKMLKTMRNSFNHTPAMSSADCENLLKTPLLTIIGPHASPSTSPREHNVAVATSVPNALLLVTSASMMEHSTKSASKLSIVSTLSRNPSSSSLHALGGGDLERCGRVWQAIAPAVSIDTPLTSVGKENRYVPFGSAASRHRAVSASSGRDFSLEHLENSNRLRTGGPPGIPHLVQKMRFAGRGYDPDQDLEPEEALPQDVLSNATESFMESSGLDKSLLTAVFQEAAARAQDIMLGTVPKQSPSNSCRSSVSIEVTVDASPAAVKQKLPCLMVDFEAPVTSDVISPNAAKQQKTGSPCNGVLATSGKDAMGDSFLKAGFQYSGAFTPIGSACVSPNADAGLYTELSFGFNIMPTASQSNFQRRGTRSGMAERRQSMASGNRNSAGAAGLIPNVNAILTKPRTSKDDQRKIELEEREALLKKLFAVSERVRVLNAKITILAFQKKYVANGKGKESKRRGSFFSACPDLNEDLVLTVYDSPASISIDEWELTQREKLNRETARLKNAARVVITFLQRCVSLRPARREKLLRMRERKRQQAVRIIEQWASFMWKERSDMRHFSKHLRKLQSERSKASVARWDAMHSAKACLSRVWAGYVARDAMSKIWIRYILSARIQRSREALWFIYAKKEARLRRAASLTERCHKQMIDCRHHAAKTLQRYARGMIGRKRAKRLLVLRRLDVIHPDRMAAKKFQMNFRMFLARKQVSRRREAAIASRTATRKYEIRAAAWRVLRGFYLVILARGTRKAAEAKRKEASRKEKIVEFKKSSVGSKFQQAKQRKREMEDLVAMMNAASAASATATTQVFHENALAAAPEHQSTSTEMLRRHLQRIKKVSISEIPKIPLESFMLSNLSRASLFAERESDAFPVRMLHRLMQVSPPLVYFLSVMFGYKPAVAAPQVVASPKPDANTSAGYAPLRRADEDDDGDEQGSPVAALISANASPKTTKSNRALSFASYSQRSNGSERSSDADEDDNVNDENQDMGGEEAQESNILNYTAAACIAETTASALVSPISAPVNLRRSIRSEPPVSPFDHHNASASSKFTLEMIPRPVHSVAAHETVPSTKTHKHVSANVSDASSVGGGREAPANPQRQDRSIQFLLKSCRSALSTADNEDDLSDHIANGNTTIAGEANIASHSPAIPFARWGTSKKLLELIFEEAAVIAWQNIFSHTKMDAYKQTMCQTDSARASRLARVEHRNTVILSCYDKQGETEWLVDAKKDIGIVHKLYYPQNCEDEAWMQHAYEFSVTFILQCFPTLSDIRELPEFLLCCGIFVLLQQCFEEASDRNPMMQELELIQQLLRDNSASVSSTSNINLDSLRRRSTAEGGYSSAESSDPPTTLTDSEAAGSKPDPTPVGSNDEESLFVGPAAVAVFQDIRRPESRLAFLGEVNGDDNESEEAMRGVGTVVGVGEHLPAQLTFIPRDTPHSFSANNEDDEEDDEEDEEDDDEEDEEEDEEDEESRENTPYLREATSNDEDDDDAGNNYAEEEHRGGPPAQPKVIDRKEMQIMAQKICYALFGVDVDISTFTTEM